MFHEFPVARASRGSKDAGGISREGDKRTTPHLIQGRRARIIPAIPQLLEDLERLWNESRPNRHPSICALLLAPGALSLHKIG
jgi:hypothetical protein